MKGTYRISRNDDKLDIIIKHGTALSQIAYRVFFLLFYMTVFLTALYYLFTGFMLEHVLYWLLPCMLIALVFFMNMLWGYKGIEKITITSKSCLLEKHTFGIKISKSYNRIEVKNLRLAEASDKKSSHFIDLLIYQKGKICFDYRDKTILFADALTIADADRLIEEIEDIQTKKIKISDIK